MTPEHEVEVHHCVAQIRDLRLNLQGSLAAEVLQWFKHSVTKSIRKRLEDVRNHRVLHKIRLLGVLQTDASQLVALGRGSTRTVPNQSDHQ